MAQPVIDLHCDLLLYLAESPLHTPLDEQARCSLPQLKAGGVDFQAFALFAFGMADPLAVLFQEAKLFREQVAPHVRGAIALEGAGPFADGPTEQLLDQLQEIGGKLLYISLTWNEENGFGGGSSTQVGLKEAGKRLLAYMAEKGIALDFSHTSDRLAEELLQEVDRQGYELPLLASHSNFRAIANQPRNLPDWLALELIRRGGLIGLNLFAPFVGGLDGSQIIDHAEYGRSLGGGGNLASGSDFFFLSGDLIARFPEPHFFPRFSSSASYPDLFSLLGQDIAYHNAHRWLHTHSFGAGVS